MHAFKIEDMPELSTSEADSLEQMLRDFLIEGLGFSRDRIDRLECRSRDGFMPYSHNKGGLEAISYLDNRHAEYALSGIFENAHKTLDEFYKYNLEAFKEARKIPADAELTDDQLDDFDNYRAEDSESTTLIGADLMLTGPNELNIRLTVSVKDAPYHRKYDDLKSIDIEFSSIFELVTQLDKLLKTDSFVASIADAAGEGV
jgi:hypothetical protein